ncbi:MAG: helix-turn-helix transcriptional regulator [Lachnospiraceae bacterium]|nr:helix-turn-helix transcriptional regulator [Lachnospiraceae bacterium]
MILAVLDVYVTKGNDGTVAQGGFGWLGALLWILILFVIYFGLIAGAIYLFVLIVKALRKYLNSGEVRKEKNEIAKTLGESLREHRLRCQMTQEFVAERLGVSRQAVSKWENGTSDPSTSNLLALAKLYGVSAEELLRAVEV